MTSPARSLILIAHNVRSTHNVGSLLRTADGLGVKKVYLTGYTPYPLQSAGDSRLPHLAQKLHKQITKTALGAETSLDWEHMDDILPLMERLELDGYSVVALEQTVKSVKLNLLRPTNKVALIVGREVEGLEPAVLAAASLAVEIPMFGSKESFNVAQAAAMALYHLRFYS